MSDDAWDTLRHRGARQYGVVSRSQAEALGLSRSALRARVERGDLEAVHDGVFRFAGQRVTWEQRALGATLLLGWGSALSHQSAGVLFKLDGLTGSLESPIEVTVPRSVRTDRGPGLSLHRRQSPFPITQQRGIPVIPLPRTLVDLASVLAEAPLEFALDCAQRRDPFLADDLARLLDDLPRGTHGVSTLRRLLAERNGLVTDSILEARAARMVRLACLPQPRSRVQVFDDHGYVMRLDLCWPAHKVALHADSYQWHQQRERFERDAAQRARLAALGWVSIPITSRGLDDGSWLEGLRRTLGMTAPQLGLPFATGPTAAR